LPLLHGLEPFAALSRFFDAEKFFWSFVPAAAKATTTTIPIVFSSGGDPVELGLVTSLNRPGGNVTGVSFLVSTITAKRLELLHELVPAAAAIGYLLNPDNPTAMRQTRDLEAAARVLGLQLHPVDAHGERDFEQAFANFVQRRIDAFIVAGDPIFVNRRDQIVALAARHAIPAIYNARTWAIAGRTESRLRIWGYS
jgi:putative ABC transport system substrate-binding protein